MAVGSPSAEKEASRRAAASAVLGRRFPRPGFNKSLSGCPAKNDSKWLALHEWLNEEQEEDED